MEWSAFLEYLQGPEVSVVVGIILALVVEYWPQFQTLESKWRQLVFAGLSLIVPLVGAVLSTFPPVSVASSWPDLWWPVLVSGGSAFLSGTLGHQVHSRVRKLVK